MATGIIRCDNIDDVFRKAAEIQCRVPSLSSSERSSSGVSSAASSPANAKVISFANPAAELEDLRGGSTNPGLVLDPSGLTSENATPRSFCTGIVSLRDELWLDIEARLQQHPIQLSKKRTLAEKCRHFVQSKWRFVSVSMLPMKNVSGDQRPLSPRDGDGDDVEKDENANRSGAAESTTSGSSSSSSSSSASGSSTSKTRPAESKKKRPRKDPDTMPPFSCTPVYVIILLAIFLVLVIGAITTIIDMRPELIYGRKNASLVQIAQELLNTNTTHV
ncbi:unnamed protein product [Cylicocyclus nassatus]|uniref:Uncharacterized protein n=1 Tax=Cylicocyclus nassatus TaxID=53992 RepID=A0AA36DV90_CYLNA|nr:unnamed protein product [Cylicocyclus nassatus]